jgi:hypothetical protein
MQFNESIWSKLSNNIQAEFEYILFSKDSIPSINIGIQRNGNKFLLLELPNNFQKQFNDIDGKILSMKYFSSEKSLLVILKNIILSEMFDDFIFSYYLRVKEIEDATEYSQILIEHFQKWNHGFTYFSQKE